MSNFQMRRRIIIILLCMFFSVSVIVFLNSIHAETTDGDERNLRFWPELYDENPSIPSPYITEDGTEIIVVITKDNKYALVPVKFADIEDFEGNLKIDDADFPTLKETGLHSELELAITRSITGRSVPEITDIGQPHAISESGFLAEGEDIISVMKMDNRIVRRIGVTHGELSGPLFRSCYLSLVFGKDSGYRRVVEEQIASFFYNDKKLYLSGGIRGKGFQESLFNDDVKGWQNLKIWREPDQREINFLKTRYRDFDDEKMSILLDRLSRITTSEMEPNYINLYGFYEGHTDYRTDPIAIAFIFGIRSIDELERAFPGKLYDILTARFTGDYAAKGDL